MKAEASFMLSATYGPLGADFDTYRRRQRSVISMLRP